MEDALIAMFDALHRSGDYEKVIQIASARFPSAQGEDSVTCLFAWVNALINSNQHSAARDLIVSELLPRVPYEKNMELHMTTQVLLCRCYIMLEGYSTKRVRYVEYVVERALKLGPETQIYWFAVRTRSKMYFHYKMHSVGLACTEPFVKLAEQHKNVSDYYGLVKRLAAYYQSVRQFAKAMHYYQILKKDNEEKECFKSYAQLCMQLLAPRLAVEILSDSELLAQARRAVVDEEYARTFVAGKERVCARCYAVGERYSKCPCFMVHYCSTKCQLEDWSAHSLTCTREKDRLCVVCHEGGCEEACSCKCVLYCSKECQLQDWPSHKHVCAKWKE